MGHALTPAEFRRTRRNIRQILPQVSDREGQGRKARAVGGERRRKAARYFARMSAGQSICADAKSLFDRDEVETEIRESQEQPDQSAFGRSTQTLASFLGPAARMAGLIRFIRTAGRGRIQVAPKLITSQYSFNRGSARH